MKRKLQLSEGDRLQYTAVHEAGHAILATHFGFPLGSVSIEPSEGYAGVTQTPESGEFMTQHPDAIFGLEKEIIITMAGAEAVKSILPHLGWIPLGDGGDREQIDIRVEELCLFTNEGASSAKRRLRHVAGCYVADLAIKSAIIDFANALLSRSTIPKGNAVRLCRRILKQHYQTYYPTRKMI